MKIPSESIPSRSTLIHLRFAFSFFLMPVYLFALSQAPHIHAINAFLVFIIWHLFIYPASNGYNSYFDKDEGSIALVEKPPQVDASLYYFSLMLESTGVLLAFWVSIEFAGAAILYGILSKFYSHPAIRLKKYPVISFLIVFVFQGAFIYWTTYAAITGSSLFYGFNFNFFLAGLICSCLIGASYPLTQVYQHAEDTKRGDKTLSLLLGIRGSFWFAAALFGMATILQFLYWNSLGQKQNFWLFLLFALPVFSVFINWFIKIWRDENQANYKNMTRMTMISGATMLLYFIILNLQ